MAPLIATLICSVDLHTVDEAGGFGWAEPSDAVHRFVNDLERPAGTYLYGRRMYETMSFWETMPDEDSVMGDYGRLWRDASKVVYSTSLAAATTARTRIERTFEPAAIAAIKASATAPVSIGGATLAGTALLAGLVDEVRLMLVPIVVGGGTSALPGGLQTALRLLETRTFDGGWVFLRYAVA